MSAFMRAARAFLPAVSIIFITILACSIPAGNKPQNQSEQAASTIQVPVPAELESPTLTPTLVTINHVMTPSSPGSGKLVYDVQSEDTAPERRAPYGDSYDINRLERPFLQDMTYVPDLDIFSYTVAGDSDWWYVSVELIGANPNNALNIIYGVELDQNHDGFGDFVIWAHPPYSNTWDSVPVQIFKDDNHNTGGLSGEKSDAPITTDGYNSLIFNGGVGDADPDMAYVRANAASNATIQFAFKKSWAGAVFMLGVLADAGLRDPSKLDYVDRFTEEEAGSPIKSKKTYPLKALFAVDNACREAFGFKPTGYEPQLCPHEAPPATRQPKTPPPELPTLPPPVVCTCATCPWTCIPK